MADKPTAVPRWANVAGDIVEPLAAKKDVGWVEEGRPPNSYMNWIQNLSYQWLNWLFEGKLGRASLTDRTPVLAFTDQDGRERLYVDPSGYFGGPNIQEHYVVYPLAGGTGSLSAVQLTPGLEVHSDINTSVLGQGADASSGAPFTRVRIDNAATGEGARILSEGVVTANAPIISPLDDLVAIFETRIRMSAIGANEVDIYFGLFDGLGGGGDPNLVNPEDGTVYKFVMFGKQSGETNWFVHAADGTLASKADSGTPPVADAFQTFRIEYHGLNTPLGVVNSLAVAKFYIDGVLQFSVENVNVPISADGGGLHVSVRVESTATGPTGDLDVEFTPIRLAWNQMLDWDVPA